MIVSLTRRLAAEAVGTALLVATVVGSGIMADQLTDDAALALLCNALATGAALVVLIAMFAPISGAQFNPVVSLVCVLSRAMKPAHALFYVAAQIAGGIVGTLIAHAMFDLPLLQISDHAREGTSLAFAEVVATFGLVALILIAGKFRQGDLPWLIGLYITAAYWFTASTSFANPAVTIARTLTDTFAGIRPMDAPLFIGAQIVGALAALAFARWMLKKTKASS